MIALQREQKAVWKPEDTDTGLFRERVLERHRIRKPITGSNFTNKNTDFSI
jgi:hypothetical protein